MVDQVLPWREVTPLEPLNGGLQGHLATLDTLRSVWSQTIQSASAEQAAEARRRSLRRHAIETGIIERLYDVSWGVTEALVAVGLTLEAAEGADGTIDPTTLAVIQAQFDALEFLADVARGARPLTVQLVRQVHQLITSHQPTYEATDHFGNRVAIELHHGEWKRWPNHVRRSDGSLLQYAPPEQVEQQMGTLVDLHGTLDGHPIIRAAWLHHRFICIHPFEDGNGRVARALVLLDLLKAHYAPLVVDRARRDEYIAALDAANDGDLGVLVRLFCDLERVALQSELVQPAETVAKGSAATVARAFGARLRDLRQVRDEERQAHAEQLAAEVHSRVRERLEHLAPELRDGFRLGDAEATYFTDAGAPGDPRAGWWNHQLIRAAKEANFWTNRAGGAWWTRLDLKVLDQEMQYVVAIQGVGAGVGVMAVTVFAEIPQRGQAGDGSGFVHPVPLIQLSASDSVTLIGGQSVDEVWPETEALIDRTLAVAVYEFGRQLN